MHVYHSLLCRYDNNRFDGLRNEVYVGVSCKTFSY